MIFNDSMGVLSWVFTDRHNKPLTGISLSVPEPPFSRQLFESNFQ